MLSLHSGNCFLCCAEAFNFMQSHLSSLALVFYSESHCLYQHLEVISFFSSSSIWSILSWKNFFGGTGIWTQFFAPTRQSLYCLSYASSPFCSGYFGDRLLLFYPGQPGQQSYFKLPIVTGITGVHHHTQFFSPSGWESGKLFAKADLEPWSSWSQPSM
jgi:hypothetical protein